MKKLTAAAAVLILSATSAWSAVVDFEDVLAPGAIVAGDPIFPYVEDGFVFTDVSSGGRNAIFDASASWNDNGTAVLGWVSNSTFAVASASGRVFDFLGFDGTNLTPGGAVGQFEVTGFFASGGSISAILAHTLDRFATYDLSGFTGLTSVQIRNAGMYDGAVDNLRLTPTPVPIPASIPLLALALGSLGLVARRRKSG
ncbi:VPLPA-CTERM sorting domain-containing protein [Antarctobacter jejuensis]|uniref:VPLPA-CTERM sorting domain-containing protein n=1 Tax=Antarctobacter jejuensis TaxID=1439938 RepID=UPI003FD0CEC2